jgi:hypothetical protein
MARVDAPLGGLMAPALAAELIARGESLVIAGDAGLLASLPRGQWIGGTIPYFMGPRGGECSLREVFVTRVAGAGDPPRICGYDVSRLAQVCTDAPDNGYSIIILPAFSAVHAHYARHAPGFEDMFMKPIVGWVSGVHLDALGEARPLVFDGTRGTAESDMALVMHVPLPDDRHAQVDIINGMRPGNGPVLQFEHTGFCAGAVRVDGVERNLAEYLVEAGIDTRLPLVADYCGAMINVSIRQVDREAGRVDFYAPVFADTDYRVAAGATPELAADAGRGSSFSCNCILNYLHGGLAGRRTGAFTGPMTFGEIAYLLLNQTLVHLRVVAH